MVKLSFLWAATSSIYQFTQVVELPSLVVEAVRDLVTDDDPDPAVVERLREVLVVEGWLEDAGREHCREKKRLSPVSIKRKEKITGFPETH